jgi:predicted nucleic acid-binding protein
MKTIFVDTNILLDVILNREAFRDASSVIWSDSETGKVQGVIAAVSLNNVYYIVAKYLGKEQALQAVRILLNVFTVVALDEKLLRLAADMPGKDFEDALQLYSAIQARAEVLVTRDLGHFDTEMIAVVSPVTYASMMK